MQSFKIKSLITIFLLTLLICINWISGKGIEKQSNDITLKHVDTTNYEIKEFAVADSGYGIHYIIPCDLNKDGFKDLIYAARNESAFMTKIYFLPGQITGFDTSMIVTILADSFITDLHIGDWDMDLNPDLILGKIRFVGENIATQDEIVVWLMDGIIVYHKILFKVPSEGSSGSPLLLVDVADFDLDGRCDLLLGGFGELNIGWNDGSETPTYQKITDKGFNTSYKSIIYDYNQDGYPDILNDDQYAHEPVIQENQKGSRSFVRKLSGLPSSPVGNYWNFSQIWFNNDKYPDIFTQRSTELSSCYEIYEFDKTSNKYVKSNCQIHNNNVDGKIIPIHINNDGYIDFLEMSKNVFRFWMNDTNMAITPTDYETPYDYSAYTLIDLDADNDNDMDVLFSFFNSNILYQLINDKQVVNSAPSVPTIDSIYCRPNEVIIEWNESTDDQALSGHINYGLTIETNNDGFINFGIHEDSIVLKNLGLGEYSLTITAQDPLESTSESSIIKNFTVAPTGIIQNENRLKLYNLNQNYPNPFNPMTVISWQLAVSSHVELSIYNILGQKISTLVKEEQNSGNHQIEWDASDVSSGIYYYRLITDNGYSQTRKMIVLK